MIETEETISSPQDIKDNEILILNYGGDCDDKLLTSDFDEGICEISISNVDFNL